MCRLYHIYRDCYHGSGFPRICFGDDCYDSYFNHPMAIIYSTIMADATQCMTITPDMGKNPIVGIRKQALSRAWLQRKHYTRCNRLAETQDTCARDRDDDRRERGDGR